MYRGVELPKPSTDGIITLENRFKSNVTKEALSFLKLCLHCDPLKRATIEDLLMHPYLEGLDQWYEVDFQKILEMDNISFNGWRKKKERVPTSKQRERRQSEDDKLKPKKKIDVAQSLTSVDLHELPDITGTKVQKLPYLLDNKTMTNGNSELEMGRVRLQIQEVYIKIKKMQAENNADVDRCFLEVEVEGKTPLGRMVIQLFRDKCPTICKNFIECCKGNFKNTKVLTIIKKLLIQGGDYETNNGTGGKLAVEYDKESYPPDDEDYFHECDEPYLVCIERGINLKLASQFTITAVASPFLKERFIVFGKVIKGTSIIKRLEYVPVVETTYVPTKEVIIVDCGILKMGEDDGIIIKEDQDIYPNYPNDAEDAESTERKIEIAEHLREIGNTYFKNGDIEKALSKYEKAFRYLVPGLRPEQERMKLEEKEIILLGNISVAKMKQKEWPTVIELCSKIMQILDYRKDLTNYDSTLVKAKFRRGVARFHRADWSSCYNDFSDALTIEPKNKEIWQWVERSKKELQKYQEKEKQIFSNLFK
ncbi:hypothetical protein ABK040_005973 [Willaertia magna]